MSPLRFPTAIYREGKGSKGPVSFVTIESDTVVAIPKQLGLVIEYTDPRDCIAID
jgi:hypothetical protein